MKGWVSLRIIRTGRALPVLWGQIQIGLYKYITYNSICMYLDHINARIRRLA